MAVSFTDMFLNVLFSLILYNRKAHNLCERVTFIPVKDFCVFYLQRACPIPIGLVDIP